MFSSLKKPFVKLTFLFTLVFPVIFFIDDSSSITLGYPFGYFVFDLEQLYNHSLRVSALVANLLIAPLLAAFLSKFFDQTYWKKVVLITFTLVPISLLIVPLSYLTYFANFILLYPVEFAVEYTGLGNMLSYNVEVILESHMTSFLYGSLYLTFFAALSLILKGIKRKIT